VFYNMNDNNRNDISIKPLVSIIKPAFKFLTHTHTIISKQNLNYFLVRFRLKQHLVSSLKTTIRLYQILK